MNNQKGNAGIIFLVVVSLLILVIVGWVLNIIALVGAGAIAAWGGVEVLRVVGIFLAPLGAVMGWFV